MNIIGVTGGFFKIFKRSYIFIFGFLATMFFSTSTFISTININAGMGEYLKTQEFGLLTIVCVVSAINIFNFNIEGSEIEYLIKDRFKYCIGSLFASILIGLTLSLIPLIYLISFIFMGNFISIGTALIEFMFIYIQAIIITASLSTILCLIFNGLIKRLITISISIILTSAVLEMIVSNFFTLEGTILGFIIRTLNVHDDFDFTTYRNFFDFVHGTDFFIDKIIIIILVLAIFYCLFKKERNIKYGLKDLIAILSSLAIILTLGYISYNSYRFTNPIFMDEPLESNSYSVENYNMNLNLNKKFKSDTTIELNFEKEEKSCKFYLSDLFEVTEVLVNGKSTAFTRDLNALNIEFTEPLLGIVYIDISYEGIVKELDSSRDILSIVSKNKILLNDDIIIWYPKLKDGKESNFTINSNDNDILSNLHNEDGTLEGKSASVILLKGNFKKINIDGYDIYTVDEQNLKTDLKILEPLINQQENKEELIKEIEKRKEIIISNTGIYKISNGMVIN